MPDKTQDGNTKCWELIDFVLIETQNLYCFVWKRGNIIKIKIKHCFIVKPLFRAAFWQLKVKREQ